MVKLNKIYTRTGDDGSTGLVDGSRTPKNAPRMDAIGDVDEANSAIGLAIIALEPGEDADMLRRVQKDLFDLGAHLATPIGEDEPEWALRIVPSQVEWLETQIDRINDPLPALDSFILPGGLPSAAAIHLARAIVRRAERSAVTAGDHVSINPLALAYLNRLSDLLFVLARHVSQANEVKWVPGGAREG